MLIYHIVNKIVLQIYEREDVPYNYIFTCLIEKKWDIFKQPDIFKFVINV